MRKITYTSALKLLIFYNTKADLSDYECQFDSLNFPTQRGGKFVKLTRVVTFNQLECYKREF